MIIIFGRCRKSAGSMLMLLVLLLLVAAPRAARADAGDSPEIEAQRLVHILGYTASDYGGAVAGGAITNPSEYEEQLSLLTDATKIAARLQPTPPADAATPSLTAGVAKVRALVESKAPEAQVGAAVVEIRAAVTAAFHLAEAPTTPPDPLRGRSLFIEHCATCHGPSGHADTTRAASLTPHPANFHDPRVGEALTPLRVAGTVRFGINGTAMVPFTFLSDADRWALAFYVTGLRHEAAPGEGSPTYTLAELSIRSDAQLTNELTAAGIPADRREAILSDLRRRAPYEDRAGKNPLSIARAKLDRARIAVARGDRASARGEIIDAYLDGIEPAEGPLRAMDASLVNGLEQRFGALRARLESGATPAELDDGIAALLGEVTRADYLLAQPAEERSFISTAISSGGILLREGVEAALLIAALLGIATQAGLGERKRWIHAGYLSALALGLVTWFASSRLIALSGAKREMIEGVTALLATLVLFYVSFSLLAKTEVARWMKFLRAQVSPGRAAASLFGVAFLAAYREAFETVLFYQALLASTASTAAAIVGALGGAVILAVIVFAYSRAGRFAPPQVFFKVSSYLLYALAVVFIGQGIAALQLTGTLPIHPLAIPSLPALGVHPTIETCTAQLVLLALAAYAWVRSARKGRAPEAPRPSSSIAKPTV
jgi:high-affinity iron transporter